VRPTAGNVIFLKPLDDFAHLLREGGVRQVRYSAGHLVDMDRWVF